MSNSKPQQQNTSLTADQALQQAMTHHRAGQLQDAERLYRAILHKYPQHPDANHNLGVLAVAVNQPDSALPFLKAALEANPHQRQYWLSYIEALKLTGDINAAQNIQLQMGACEFVDGEPSHCDTSALSAYYAERQYTKAEEHARIMTERFPLNPFGWKVLGAALMQLGRHAEALDPIKRALALLPDDAIAHNTLGAILKNLGRLDEATTAYQSAISIKPDYAEAYNNLGNAFLAQGQIDEATASYRRALSIKEDYAEAHFNLGNTLLAQGKPDLAIASFQQAIFFNPEYAPAYNNLGNALKAHGRPTEAIECYRQAIKLDSKYEFTQHIIAAISGDTSDRAPGHYIEHLFDDYANRFDEDLVRNLKYKTPEALVTLLGQATVLPVTDWNVLDLGCGTGLSGVEIAPHAKHLVGVDLSTHMLAKAQNRNIYSRLVHSDLLPMMQKEIASSYDLIIAADVFVYLGRLEEIIFEAKRLLRLEGFLAFSVEALQINSGNADIDKRDEYVLNQTGRFAHSETYLNSLAFTHHFTPIRMVSAPVRFENGLPVPSLVVVWKSTS